MTVRPQQSHVWQAVLVLGAFAFLLLLLITPFTTPILPIERDTAQWVTQYTRLGNGLIMKAKWSPDGQTVAMAGTLGIWLYDANNFISRPRLLDRNTSFVYTIAYHPTLPLLLSGDDNGTMALWNVETGTQVTLAHVHELRVVMAVFSPNGETLISSSVDNTLAVWDVDETNLSLRYRIDYDQYADAISFHPTQPWFAVLANHMITVYETMSGEIVAELPVSDELWTGLIAFSTDGLWLVGGNPWGGSSDGIIASWSIERQQFLQMDLGGNVNRLDPATIAYFDQTPHINLMQEHDAVTLRSLYLLEQRTVNSHGNVALSPDGTHLLAHFPNEWVLWDLAHQRTILHLFAVPSRIGELVIRADGEQVASTDGYLWSRMDGPSLPVTNASYYNIVFYDGMTPFLLNDNRVTDMIGQIQVSNLSNRQLVHEYPEYNREFFALVISPNHHYFAVSNRYEITIWRLTTTPREDVDVPVLVISLSEPIRVDKIAFSPDGQIFLVSLINRNCSCSVLQEWNVITGTLIREVELPHRAYALAVHPAGDPLFFGSTGGEFYRFNRLAEDSNDVFELISTTLGAIADIHVNSQENVLAANSLGGMLRLWQLPEYRLITEFVVGNSHGGATYGIAFTPDGTVLAAGTVSGRILLIDTHTGEILNTLEGHRGSIYSIDFNTNGDTLASIGSDGTVRLWRVGR